MTLEQRVHVLIERTRVHVRTGASVAMVMAIERAGVIEFVNTSVEMLQYLEQRLLFLRLTIKFAWAAEEGDGGRLYVWGVQM